MKEKGRFGKSNDLVRERNEPQACHRNEGVNKDAAPASGDRIVVHKSSEMERERDWAGTEAEWLKVIACFPAGSTWCFELQSSLFAAKNVFFFSRFQ